MKRVTKATIIMFFVVFLMTSGIAFAAAAAPNDPMFNSQWGHYNTGQSVKDKAGTQGMDANILNAWEITKGSGNVVVGVLDTGIDISHEDLTAAIYTNPGEIPNNGVDDDKNGYVDDINGWDFANDDNTVYDNEKDDSHGTSLAGLIAATANNGKGISGVAPNVKILPLKFRNGLLVNGDRVKDAIDAIYYAKALGVKIINCSFTTPNSYDLRKAMEDSGMLFICASGNGGNSLDYVPSYPITYGLSNVIGVASINSRGELSAFSGYGKCVALAAPGEDINSTWPGNQYRINSGTSASVPYVTGVAALIQSIKPNLKATEIADAINSSIRPLESLNGKVGTGGMLDAYSALKYVSSGITASNGVELTLSGTEGTDGWYRSDVIISAKLGSSKTTLYYSFDGQAWQKYETPVTVKQEGKTGFSYYLEDENKLKGKAETKEVKIDKSKPVIKVLSPKNGETFLFGSEIKLQYYSDEKYSGVKGYSRNSYDVDIIPANKAGLNIMKLTVEDKAGNITTMDLKYKVVYKDCKIQEPAEGTVIKKGTPVLIKFGLSNADGAAVDTAKAKLFTAYVNNRAAAKEVPAKSSISAAAGNSFTYDKTAKKYSYSLSTKDMKPGKYHLRIELDDGTSKNVNIVIR